MFDSVRTKHTEVLDILLGFTFSLACPFLLYVTKDLKGISVVLLPRLPGLSPLETLGLSLGCPCGSAKLSGAFPAPVANT